MKLIRSIKYLQRSLALAGVVMALLLSGNFAFAGNTTSWTDTLAYRQYYSFKPDLIPGIVSNESEIRAGLLYDVDRDRIVWEKDMDYSYPIASLTKMMVGLLAVEDIEAGKVCWDDKITVTRTFRKKIRRRRYTTYSVEEHYSLEDLLKMAMVGSHNESTVWIAKHCEGSLEAFVERMNKRAFELGMIKTQYSNPSGLPAIIDELDNSASPRDLLVLGLEIMKHPKLVDITSIPYATVSNGKGKQTYRNHNGLVINYNQEVDGIKTGFTRAAGFCLVSTCTRGGHRLMSVVLGCRSPWVRNGLVASMINTYFDAIKLGRLGEAPVDGFESRAFLDSVDRGLAMITPLVEPKAKDSSDESYAYTYKTVTQKVRKTHTVRRGDSLGKIADRYDVAMADLKKWNHLKKSTITPGQKLAIYSTVKRRIPVKLVIDPEETLTDNLPTPDEAEEQETIIKSEHAVHEKPEPVVAENPAPREERIVEDTATTEKEEQPVVVKQSKVTTKVKVAPNKKSSFIYHVVQPGDTLWNIAQRYQANVDQIKKVNRISNSRSLKSGTRIKIPVKG
jgi:D-alanyl-D-alanine carboxypeptidase (penicillin-binding protein 5/6)